MDQIIIKKASISDWKIYREIRLDALKTNPESFGRSYEEEAWRNASEWKKGFKDKNRIKLVALDGEKAIGVVVNSFEPLSNLAHVANIFSVYVKPEYRGKGISTQLMRRAIGIIKSQKRIKKVKLSVVTKQLAAINLYKRFGFKIVGKLIRELKVKNRYYDEYVMELIL